MFYTKISEQTHPNIDNYSLNNFKYSNNSNITKNIDKFNNLIKKINNKYEYKPSGEWKWIEDNKHCDMNDSENLEKFLINDYSYGVSFGRIQNNNYNLIKNKILCDFETWKDLSIKKDIFINEVGNDYYIDINYNDKNYKVSSNVCRHNYQAERILNTIDYTKNKRKVILEIGGGYGGLIFQFTNLLNNDNFCWINIDLPKQLFLTYYYLSNSDIFIKKKLKIKLLMPDEQITDKMINNYNIILGIQNQISNINVDIDILVNFNSLSEMSNENVKFYINQINKLKVYYIYHQNSNYDIFSQSKHEHQEVLANSFEFNNKIYDLILINICPWLEGNGRYREYLYKKIKN